MMVLFIDSDRQMVHPITCHLFAEIAFPSRTSLKVLWNNPSGVSGCHQVSHIVSELVLSNIFRIIDENQFTLHSSG